MRQRVASVTTEQQVAVGLAADTRIVKSEQQPIQPLGGKRGLRTARDLDNHGAWRDVGEHLEDASIGLDSAHRTPLSHDAISCDGEVRVSNAQPSITLGAVVGASQDKHGVRFALHPTGILAEIDGFFVLGMVLDVKPAEAVHTIIPIQLQFRGLAIVVRHGFLPEKPDRIVADIRENGSLDFSVGAVAGYANN